MSDQIIELIKLEEALGEINRWFRENSITKYHAFFLSNEERFRQLKNRAMNLGPEIYGDLFESFFNSLESYMKVMKLE